MTEIYKLNSGTLIKASPLLNDSYFEGCIIFITELNKNGAIGFILNNPYYRRFNELQEFTSSPALQLFEGGPMEHEKLFILHKKSDLINDSQWITPNIYFGGNFKQAVTLMNSGILAENDFKLFIGYCGWDAGELEAEIEEGSWEILEKYQVL